jgi:small subunit ribosomal protein S17
MPRRILEGEVVSNKANKTITVLVERRTMHPVYKKYIRSSKKYAAHDENNQFNIGDKVQIMECRPISKSKSWTVLVDGKPVAMPAKQPSAAKAPAAKKAAAPKKPAAKKSAKKDA